MLLTCYIDKFLTRIHNYTHPLHYIYIAFYMVYITESLQLYYFFNII